MNLKMDYKKYHTWNFNTHNFKGSKPQMHQSTSAHNNLPFTPSSWRESGPMYGQIVPSFLQTDSHLKSLSAVLVRSPKSSNVVPIERMGDCATHYMVGHCGQYCFIEEKRYSAEKCSSLRSCYLIIKNIFCFVNYEICGLEYNEEHEGGSWRRHTGQDQHHGETPPVI